MFFSLIPVIFTFNFVTFRNKLYLQNHYTYVNQFNTLNDNEEIENIENILRFKKPTDVLPENEELKRLRKLRNENKTITISPGGFMGIYMLGICKFIKTNYETKEYIFSGASAGSWNSLYMVCKKDIDFTEIEKCIMKNDKIYDIELSIKDYLLRQFSNDDFDLSRLSITLITLQHCKLHKTVYNKFDNLEDAIDCCIASCHIPFITGGLYCKYKKRISFDGAYVFSSNNSFLHISPDMWFLNHFDLTVFSKFSKKSYNIYQLYYYGYLHASTFKLLLDNLLL